VPSQYLSEGLRTTKTMVNIDKHSPSWGFKTFRHVTTVFTSLSNFTTCNGSFNLPTDKRSVVLTAMSVKVTFSCYVAPSNLVDG